MCRFALSVARDIAMIRFQGCFRDPEITKRKSAFRLGGCSGVSNQEFQSSKSKFKRQKKCLIVSIHSVLNSISSWPIDLVLQTLSFPHLSVHRS